jgi:hypothetical protein
MQIRQIQVACDAFQDRLTLRISTQANEEFRVWFTRRYLRELWPLLSRMLAGHLAPGPQLAGQQSNNEAPTFSQPFNEDNPVYPLGAAPLLASEATLEAVGEGLARLTFREGRERSFNLSLTADLLQSLCAMLRASAEQAGWNLTLDYQQTMPSKATANMPSNNTPHLLH